MLSGSIAFLIARMTLTASPWLGNQEIDLAAADTVLAGAGPVGRTIRRTLTRGFQDTRLGLSCPRSALTTAIMRIESCQTLLLKALLPRVWLKGG
jgi:hypothetical protein